MPRPGPMPPTTRQHSTAKNNRIHQRKTPCRQQRPREERVGGGIWYRANHPRNLNLQNTNAKITGILAAILWGVKDEPPFNDLLIKTSSKILVDGLKKKIPK
jgi:hypothetical protein